MKTITTDEVLVGGQLFIMELAIGDNPEENYITLTEACTCEEDIDGFDPEWDSCDHVTYDFRGIA